MNAEGNSLDRHSATDLIRAALERDDPAAVELMWGRYAGELYAVVLASLRSKHDAEDVLQAIFVKVVRKRRQLAKARCLNAYVHQIARNEIANFLRQRRRKPGSMSDVEPWLTAVDTADTTNELAEEVQTALNRLPQTQREVLILKVYGNKTFREIAETLELSLNTVASRYRYSLDKLKELLKDSIL
jgi:RNA polymerase sigma-70 factor (ECF subfamily)